MKQWKGLPSTEHSPFLFYRRGVGRDEVFVPTKCREGKTKIQNLDIRKGSKFIKVNPCGNAIRRGAEDLRTSVYISVKMKAVTQKTSEVPTLPIYSSRIYKEIYTNIHRCTHTLLGPGAQIFASGAHMFNDKSSFAENKMKNLPNSREPE